MRDLLAICFVLCLVVVVGLRFFLINVSDGDAVFSSRRSTLSTGFP